MAPKAQQAKAAAGKAKAAPAKAKAVAVKAKAPPAAKAGGAGAGAAKASAAKAPPPGTASSGAKAGAAKASAAKAPPAAKASSGAAAKASAAKASGAKAAAADAAGGGPAASTPTLRDAAVVMTGELDGMTRDEAMDKLKAAGAKVMSGVSGKTTFLIVGSHLDDGRDVEQTSKYRKYLELKAKGGKCPEVLREPELLAMLGASGPMKSAALLNDVTASAPPSVVARTYSTAVEVTESWVNRHTPTKLDDLLGNASSVKKLSTWLRDWDDVVLRGRKKVAPFRPGGGMPENLNARAALISGPPGIGKTTAARLVAKSLGWEDILEFNASDARSKKIISSLAEGLADNRTLTFGGSSSSSSLGRSATPQLSKRAVIIMDEVDGMGAGDRGGNAALIQMIKKTKNPIICICNDHGSQKVRSLAFSCYDVRFSRPTKSTIAQRAAQVAASEGLGIEPNALEALAESCGNDVRHVLNQLQVMAKIPQYQASHVGYMDMKERLHEIAKDSSIMLNPFEACRHLLTSSVVQKMSMRDKFDHFFIDLNLMHLMVQENYLNSVSKKPIDDQFLETCARSAECIALGDIVNDRIRGSQEWSLLPDMGLLGAIYPASLTNGFVSFPEFPKFLGNFSKMGRATRLCAELQAHLRLSSAVQTKTMVSSGYAERLYRNLMKPLQEDDVAGAAAVLDAYGLQREHLAEHLNELMQHATQMDEFKLVDPKVKAAMTREMNSGGHAVKVVLPASKKRRVAVPEGDDIGDEAEKDAPAKEGEEGDDAEGAKGTGDDDSIVGGLVRRAKAKAKRAASSSTAASKPAKREPEKARGKAAGKSEPAAKRARKG